MIKMVIDIWQVTVKYNCIPELILQDRRETRNILASKSDRGDFILPFHTT